jgi:hypothetical protein
MGSTYLIRKFVGVRRNPLLPGVGRAVGPLPRPSFGLLEQAQPVVGVGGARRQHPYATNARARRQVTMRQESEGEDTLSTATSTTSTRVVTRVGAVVYYCLDSRGCHHAPNTNAKAVAESTEARCPFWLG